MEYAEALDVVARSRTQFQAFEKLDEVLKKAQGAENHVKELDGQREDLQKAVEAEQANLDDIVNRRNTMAAEFDGRISQLKKAEEKARLAVTDAEFGWNTKKQELQKKWLDMNAELQVEYTDKKAELEADITTLREQAVDLQQNIAKMKEAARAVVG